MGSGATNSGGRAGVDGLPAGDIVLAVGEILTDSPGVRLEPTVIDTLVLRQATLVGGSFILEWVGGPGIRLQTRAALDAGEWTDVPGTEGVSGFSVPGQSNSAGLLMNS